MHLIRKFGHTVDEIVRDGWPINARIRMQTGSDEPTDQAAGLSRGVLGIAKFLEKDKTDIVLVLGDRIEAMAGALAAVTTGRIVAHIHGGDIAPGDIDNSLRHAITKLAHIHLAATRDSRQRIIKMGEDPNHVHHVGAPGLDRLVELVRRTAPKRERTGLALILQHPCGRSAVYENRVMNAILRAVGDAGLGGTIIYPNSDRGHEGIIKAIEVFRHRHAGSTFHIARSLDRDTYLRKLIEANVLIGNSSSGIIEAATAGTPVVNIGPRQQGRQRAGRLIVDADESFTSIRDALGQALRKRPIIGAPTIYGDGGAGLRIAKILGATAINDRLRTKAGRHCRSFTKRKANAVQAR
jgi:UDP-N-acetylglucosamine 2-epimerase (non-hydrolysing)/GDP/UDP-N,N'-diacetylbacillosamine 2-epimerase (hydrolysing)